MKSVTIRLPDKDLNKLRAIKDQGFSTLAEVIKCASLSFIQHAEKLNTERLAKESRRPR
jgi:hypothetical protein